MRKKQNRMPGLRLKGEIWHIEKRCKHAEGGWIRESTETSSRTEAEQILIRRLAELEAKAQLKAQGFFTFEQAAFRYLEDKTDKPSVDSMAMHLDQVLPFIGELTLEQIHDGTLKPFVDHETKRGLAPKSINNVITIITAVLNRAARVWRTEEGIPWLCQVPPRLSRLPIKGKQARAYTLSWDEQDRLFASLPDYLADAATFGINTGCREQEICQLRWDWEIDIPDMDTSVFVLPESITKTSVERVVVLNSAATEVIDRRRDIHPEFVFTYRGRSVGKIRTSAWRRAWERVGLPTGSGVLKGVHNLRHTFATRLRAAGVPLETRKALMGHAAGDITTHYSAAELQELLTAAEKVTDRGIAQTPTLSVIKAKSAIVGKVSEKEKGLTAK
ncbi:MAG: site-specific integrase [Candidatus Sedimenticola sp. 4PFRAG1]